MSEMELARYNIFWIACLLLPLATMFYAAMSNTYKVIIPAVAISIVGTYVLAVLACERKWDLRVAYVCEKYNLADDYFDEPMPEEAQRAFADGANLVFTIYFLAPIEALFVTFFWYAVGRARFEWLAKHRPKLTEPVIFNDQP